MNGVHDLGGTDGLGPVPVPKEEPVFRADLRCLHHVECPVVLVPEPG